MSTRTTEPHWVAVLRAECEKAPQRQVAGQLGYSHTAINQVLKGKYQRSLDRIEAAVRKTFPESFHTPTVSTCGDPEWLVLLRDKCATSSQRRIAELLGVSSTVVNQVLHGKYPGNLKRIETLVRGRCMDEKVRCPVAGEIPMSSCASQQDRSWSRCNHPELRYMYKRCRAGCPNSFHPVNLDYVEELQSGHIRGGR